MTAWMRLQLAGLLVAQLVLGGCAVLRGPAAAGPGPEIRPNAPPEYDVLVGQQHENAGNAVEALAAYRRAAAKDPDSAYLHRKLAELLARNDRPEESLVHATRAYELEPEDVPTRIFLGHLHRLRRDPASAEGLLVSESGEPLDENAGYLLFHVFLENGRLEDAVSVATWLVETQPENLRGRIALATAYQRLERPLDAEAVLREALEAHPDNLRVYDTLARSRRERGDRPGEIEVYREVLGAYPDHHATLVALAEAQMALDDLPGATATFERIERLYPNDLRSMVRLGFLKYEARAYPEAAIRFERALEARPEEYEIAFFLGIVRRRSGDERGAIEAFERVPEEHPQFAESRTQLATIYESNSDYASALREVEKASAVKPSRALDLYAATLRVKGGDLDGAVAQLHGLLDEQPDDDELLYNIGIVYGEAKQIDESLRYMQMALQKNPQNASALNYVGYTWAERGINLDEAEEMITRALELRPEDGYITDSLGWVYYMRARSLMEAGQRQEAQPYLDRAVRELQRADRLTGGDPVVSEHLGDTYLLLEDRDSALEHFEEAIRLEPRSGEQPELLKKLEDLRRERE